MIERLIQTTPTIARVNVTPIIDVALVLVIILLITAPMMALADLDLDLPPARTQSLGEKLRINVTLGRDGRLAVDDAVVDRADFGPALAAVLQEHAERDPMVVLRADEGAHHRDVRALLQDARSAGAARIAIAARAPEGGSR